MSSFAISIVTFDRLVIGDVRSVTNEVDLEVSDLSVAKGDRLEQSIVTVGLM